MEEFNYESIAIGQSKQIRIDKNTPAFLFNSGKSYFKAYELPFFTQPYHVKIVSYSMATMESGPKREDSFFEKTVGPTGEYVFYPTLLTLDKNFNVVRKSSSNIFLPQMNAWLEIPSKFAAMAAGFKLIGQLPFKDENKEEKYLVLLTTEELLQKETKFQLPKFYQHVSRVRVTKNAPAGAIVLSLVTSSDLIEEINSKWFLSLENLEIDKIYSGVGFSFFPSQNSNYKFYGIKKRLLSFIKIQGGEIIGAYVESQEMGQGSPSPELTIKRVILSEEERLKNEFVDLRYEKSKITVDGVECDKIDLFGKLKQFMCLPTKGYDISCVHPDWSGKTPTLFVHIVAFYTNPEVEFITPLPKELLDFYNGVQFIKVEQ
jgi:hypothetical protein